MAGKIIEYGNLVDGSEAGWEVLARFSKPGAAYKNVSVVDADGNTLLNIPDGANRYETGTALWKPVGNNGNLVILGNGVSGLNIAANGEDNSPQGLLGIGNTDDLLKRFVFKEK